MSDDQDVQVLRKKFQELMYLLEQRKDWDGVRDVSRLAVARGCFLLRAEPVWSPADFWFVPLLESVAPAMIAEVESLGTRFDEYLSTVPDPIYEGTWNQIMIYDNGRLVPEAAELLPVMAETLAKIPEINTMVDGVAGISKLDPGSHITPHCGRTNGRLRVHMGIDGLEGCHLRVGEHTLRWERGQCFVFDDSFEHEVVHQGDRPRVILLADFWHPDLTADQIRNFTGPRSRKAKMAALKRFMNSRGLRRIEIEESGRARLDSTDRLREQIESRCRPYGIRLAEIQEDGSLRVERNDPDS